MELFIYFPISFQEARDELEDSIQDFLGDRGEVTGGGAGVSGSNIDLEIFEEEQAVLNGIRKLLRSLGAPPETTLILSGKKEALGD